MMSYETLKVQDQRTPKTS